MMTGKQQCLSPSSQGGFTLIESLLAIMVVAILLVGLSPVIVLSTATRIQARRVELATQAARAYIDGVRSGAIAAPPDPSNTFLVSGSQDFLANAPVQSSPGSLNIPAGQYSSVGSDQVYCIDGDGDGKCTANSLKDMIVQPFRSITAASKDPNNGYRLAIRVYRADAFMDAIPLKKSDQTNGKVTASPASGTVGNRKLPLVEMTTDIANDNTTFSNFCDRLKNPANNNSRC